MSMTASYHELTFDALDRLSACADRIVDVIKQRAPVTGCVVLATCNRFELYIDIDAQLTEAGIIHAARHIAGMVASESDVDAETALASFRITTGNDSAAHLFSVAAGLDSMVVGEREIAGQVKRALAASHDAGASSPLLEMLFQRAARTSKRVAEQTGLGHVGRSIVTQSLEVVAPSLPPWKQVRALLVGTGFYAGAVFAELTARGCTDISVFSPSGRAATFTAKHQAVAVSDLATALNHVDIVMACSGAHKHCEDAERGYVIDETTLADAARPLILVDLALHNDVDPAAGLLDGIILLDLAELTAQAPAADAAAIEAAKRIVDDAVIDFEETRLGREADAAVVALRVRADEHIAAKVAELVESAKQSGETDIDIDAITRRVRGPIHAQLHQHILATRASALEAAKANASCSTEPAAHALIRTE